jgi:hypothetical protein
MKILKQLLFAGMVSLGLAALAQAQTTTVYITGSTAFRGATHTAISKRLSNVQYGYVGSSFTGASQAIFEGDVANNHVIVKTSWSGSVGGIQTVSKGLAIPFLPDGTARSASPGTGSATAATAANGDVAIPDVAMADNYQIATPFTTPTLTSTTVGVVEFKFVASADAPAGLNMTPQLAQALFQNGSLPLSLFTGKATDETTKVFATGRDPDSGTRVTTFAESGVGVFAQVVQYQPAQDQNGNITGQVAWPESVVNGITFPQGNGGFSSGGTLANVLKLPTTAAIGGFYVSYLSVGDAATAIGGGAKEMSYNGVLRGADPTNTRNGFYTFWGYEQLMYKAALAGAKRTTADQIADQIRTVDSPVLLSTMRVSRTQDGGLIRPTF